MRITYRHKNVKEYWNSRWDEIDSDFPMSNVNVYPLKYAIETIGENKGKILEAGCGAGRILRYYHDRGADIIGIDYIEVAIQKLKKTDPSLVVEVADITDLNFQNESFDYVLAFGLYHNLEYGLESAIKETFRIMKHGGKLCLSFRADNIQTRLNDWLTSHRNLKNNSNDPLEFHKMNLTHSELRENFREAGFSINSIVPVENMPILYKFSFFRALDHKNFDENIARAEGYKLTWIGQIFQNFLMKVFPNQFCNIYVLIAQKNR